MIVIAERLGNLENLIDYAFKFEEDKQVELRVYLRQPLDQEELDQLELDLVSQSVVLISIDQDNRVLRIRLRKTSHAFNVITDSINNDILGWQLCKKEERPNLLWPALIGSAMVLLLIGGKIWPGKK